MITGGLGVGLDCESVSLSSSTTSGGRRSARILGMAIPGIRNQSRGASLEKQGMEDIPEQLRTPKVPQVSPGITLLLSGTLKSPVSFLIIGQRTGQCQWTVLMALSPSQVSLFVRVFQLACVSCVSM